MDFAGGHLPCEGMCDAESEKALAAAFGGGEHKRVTRLHRGDELPIEQCWVRGPAGAWPILRQQAGNLPVREILQSVQKLTGCDSFRLGIV